MGLKNLILLGLREPRKQRQHLGIAQHGLVRQVLAQVVGGLADLALARQKNQDVPMHRAASPELVHPIGNGLVEPVVAAFFKRPKTLLHRKGAARHQQHGRRPLAGGKVVRKALRIDGGRGDDHLQIGPTRQQLAQVAQQKVNVQAALVGLVNDDGVVGPQQRVGLGFGQQNAVGHELDRGAR